jgi:hypothetical protein
MVLIAPPPPTVPVEPSTAELPAGTRLVRIFDPTRHQATATSFRFQGPYARFDHHEGSGPERRPDDSPLRGIYYAARTLSGCLVEVFGDTRVIEFGERHVAGPALRRPVRLLDLRGPGAMRAGSVAALAKSADRSLSQAWARYLYEHPGIYGLVDGLLYFNYFNAHNDEEALALFERAADALTCAPDAVARLDAPGLRPLILDLARQNNLVLP